MSDEPTEPFTKRLAGFYAAHPEQWWRPKEVAEQIGESTHKVANGTAVLAARGRLLRRRMTRARSVYRWAEGGQP